MPDPKQYTVGWICALSIESIAACLFLDKEHKGRSDHLSANDSNDYTLSEMSGLNVVIAVMPDGGYGQTSATGVIKDMLNSFPNIRVGMMVGIRGGALTAKHDIRLGDVVYDYGKLIQGQGFQHIGFLNQPSTLVRTTVSGLKTQYKRKGHKIEETIRAILDDNPRLSEEFGHPGEDKDRLYRSDVAHSVPCGEICEDRCGAQPAQMVGRRKRSAREDSLAIHHGIVASGSSLMKDVMVRDTLAMEMGVMCFEMEAAGLTNHFPCLVVRGISGCSDLHKNKQW
ncbi:purine and uridine phosphorylase [Aureobasidium namibiae CBS 147.97]|uniref:Purine and uridine phosphorylase n=1 Tax=Aureobasidium namibiae CBS 147.97 TaxID=1043004 RepID=A0A074X8C1_9PEZI